jgi:hypothetical protein
MRIHSTRFLFLFGKVGEQFGKSWQHSRDDAAHREADLLAKFNALRNNFQKGGEHEHYEAIMNAIAHIWRWKNWPYNEFDGQRPRY